MRVLIDECVPRGVRRHLTGHDVRTVHEMGWSGKKDAVLLALMAAQGFEVIVTVDRGLPHQHHWPAANLAAIVLVAAGNRMADLLPLMPSALAALASIRPGDAVEVTV